MNKKARQKIEEKIADIEYSMKYKHPYPYEFKRLNPDKYEIIKIVKEIQLYSILRGIKFGLEKALEIIDEEERNGKND